MYNNYAIKPISHFDSFHIFFSLFYLPLFANLPSFLTHGDRCKSWDQTHHLARAHLKMSTCTDARTLVPARAPAHYESSSWSVRQY